MWRREIDLSLDMIFDITEDFASWCKLVSKECRFSERAGECGVVHFSRNFFES